MNIPIEELVNKYKDNIFTLSLSICKNMMDAEDVVQETFIKYYQSKKEFDDEEHIKAWLLRVAINKSKDKLRAFWRKNIISWEDCLPEIVFETEENQEVFEAVLKLSTKYRIVIHLFYYENYSVKEISYMLGINENTIKVRMMRARKMLKENLEVWNENE